MKNSTKVILLIGTAIAGVSTYLYVQIRKIIKSPFKVVGATDVDLTGGEVKFTLLCQKHNDSDISAHINNQYYEVFLNDKLVSKIQNKSHVFVGANKTTIIPVKVEINKNQFLKASIANLTNLIMDKSKVKLSLVGYFHYKAGVFGAKQPLDLSFTLQEILDMKKQDKK